MPKKTFKKVADDNPALAFLGKQDGQAAQAVHDVQDVHDVQAVHDVHDVHDAHDVHTVHDVHDVQPEKTILVKYTNINLRVTHETKDFLTDESWKSRMNITQYINALIQSDMDAKRVGQGDCNV